MQLQANKPLQFLTKYKAILFLREGFFCDVKNLCADIQIGANVIIRR
jgi:hypothetical protein